MGDCGIAYASQAGQLSERVEPSILDSLKSKRDRLQRQLDETNLAITGLESNPEVAKVLELTMRAVRS